MKTRTALVAGALALSLSQALAEDAKPRAEDGMKPSEILAAVEARPDFLRLVDMSWNERGYYEIEYRTRDKAKVEINMDPKSGKPVDVE